jgi:hypothetical protein
MDESERDQLLERIERLERSVKRGEDGLEVYARGFAKLRSSSTVRRSSFRRSRKPTHRPSAACSCGAAPVPPTRTRSTLRRSRTPRPPNARRRPPPPSHCGPARPGLGPRRSAGFAIAGGAVMALGIGFFFVLAANRGWIGEEMRIALGATASAVVFAPAGVASALRAVLVGARRRRWLASLARTRPSQLQLSASISFRTRLRFRSRA